MKNSIKESIPDTVPALEIFIKECTKEINRFSRLQKAAQHSLDLKTGRIKTDYGIHN